MMSIKQQLKPLAISLCLFGFISSSAFADVDQTAESKDAQQMEAISSRTQDVEVQLAALQKEVKQLKHQLKAAHSQLSQHLKKQVLKKSPMSLESEIIKHRTDSVDDNSGPDSYAMDPEKAAANRTQFLPVDFDVPGQSFVSTGPYIGVPLMYSGGDLIINSPSINEDVALLNVRKNIIKRLSALGRASEGDHAHLLLSGIVEGQAMYKMPGVGSSNSDVNVTSAGLDGYILGPSSWTSALISLNYDNNQGTATGSLNSNARTQNSRVFIKKAFIVIGNFTKSPFYGTIGQMYVPFGSYGSNMVSGSVTKILGRTKERAFLLGYQQPGPTAFYGSAYVFRGDTYVGGAHRLNNGGLNVGYRFVAGKMDGNIGASILANLADSEGMQNNGFPTPFFGGFGAANNMGNEQITHRVPAMDVRALLSLDDHINLVGEYVGALTAFSRNDLTFNTHGAKPQALNLEASYTFQCFSKPSSLAIGYAKTKDGLALGLPAQRYSMTANTSMWKDTLQSLEFRHDINYAAGNFATGSNIPTQITGSGKPDNSITAQFDIYF